MANNSGFILVDASEATSMADTAKNSLRPRSGEGGSLPKHLDTLVKALKEQAKEQQKAAAKELAESETLGDSVKELLKFAKVLKKDLLEKLDERKKAAEETLKEAAGNVMDGKGSRKPQAARPQAARPQDDTGGSFDADNFRIASRNIDGMRGPASAANDLIADMRAGFNNVRLSAMALGDELYGHSILPDIQTHLQAIIDQLNAIKNDADLLNKLAAVASPGPAGLGPTGQASMPAVNPIGGDIKELFSEHLKKLENIFDNDRKTTFGRLNSEFDQIRASLNKPNQDNDANSRKAIGNINATVFEDPIFEAFLKDFLLTLGGALEKFMALQIPIAVMNIQQLNKEVNNLQGGMAGNVEKARAFRIEMTNALQDIRSTGGFTIQELGAAAQQVMALGVSGPEMIAKQSEAMLMGARALGAEVSDVAQTYGLQARNLKLSVNQIPVMISGTLRVARETGLTAKNVLEIRKETQAFSEELRRAGSLSAQLTNELTRTQAIATKLGLGNFQQDLQKVFMDISQMGNIPDDLAIITAYVRNDLVKMGYSTNEILTGTMLTTLQGQRDFAKATKNSLELLQRQAEAMGSEAGAANYLQNVTKGRIKSLEELTRLIQLQTQASESQVEKAERLRGIEKQLLAMRASGVSEALMGNAIAELTGDTSMQTIADVQAAISTAQQGIATDQENLAADFMNKLIKRQAQLMSTQDMSASQAKDKAFQEISGTVKGELSGMSMQEISSLAAKAAQRAAEDVAQSAESATDNMVDRVAQGVQKGIQMVAGPFADLVDFFDSMGIGPFVAGVAIFSTAAVMLTSSIRGLYAIISKLTEKSIFAKVTGDGVNARTLEAEAAANTVSSSVASGASAASSAVGAGDAAVQASSQTAQTARTISDYVVQIGDAGDELWKQKGKLMKGLAVLAIIGVAIGGAIFVMSQVYPEPSVVMGVAASIAGSVVAFGALAAAAYGMGKIGEVARGAGEQMKNAAVGLGVLVATGFVIGAMMWALVLAFPSPESTLQVAKAMGASALAFAALAAAFWIMAGTGLALNAIIGTGVGVKVLIASIAAGMAAMVVTAAILGASMVLLVKYFPDAQQTTEVAKAIGASALAFGILAGAFFGIMAVGGIFMALNFVGLLAIGVGIEALAKSAKIMGNGIQMLHENFKNPEKIKVTAEAVSATAGAFRTLAGAILGIMTVGVVFLAMNFIGLLAIGSAIMALAATAVVMSAGINMLHGYFKNPEKIKATGEAISATADAFSTLAGAFFSLMWAGARIVLAGGLGWALTIGALWTLTDFGKQMSKSIDALGSSFSPHDEIKKTAETITVVSGAFKDLSEAYKSVIDSANLSWWRADLDVKNNKKALDSLLAFGEQLGSYMDKLNTSFGDTKMTKEVVDRVNTSAKVIGALAAAGLELKKYKDETEKVFTSISPEDLILTMTGLTQIAEGIGANIPKIVANAPSADDASRIQNAAKTMTSIAEMMRVILDMQNQFGEGRFNSGPMKAMDTFMTQLGNHMADPRGGFHALKRGVESMPAFREDEVEKLNMMNKATVSVFDTLKTLGEINDEFPNSAMFARDLGSINKTLNLAVKVFTDNKEPLTNLKNLLGAMPSDIGNKAEAFAKMMESLKTSLLNIEILAKEFPKGGERSMEVMNDHLRYIAGNLDKEAIQAISDTFDNVTLDLPDRIDALSGGFERLPNLLMQVQRFIDRVDRPALERAHDDILFIAWALAPLADLAESLSFDAPNIEHFERQIANLILVLGAATQSIPEVLELRSEIEANVGTKGGASTATETINSALTGPPGSGGTIGNIDELNTAMALESSTSASNVSMGGAESRLDTLIKEQQQTNQLMRQLVAAMIAPPSRAQQSGAAPRKTLSRTGSTRPIADPAWAEESLITP